MKEYEDFYYQATPHYSGRQSFSHNSQFFFFHHTESNGSKLSNVKTTILIVIFVTTYSNDKW